MSSFISKLRNTMGAFGACVEETVGDDLFPTIHVKNDPIKVKSEKFELPPLPAKLVKKDREHQHKVLKRRYKNFTQGIDLFKSFQWVELEKLVPCAENWNYFKLPNSEQLMCLMASIEAVGIISPLVLVKEKNENFTIINGHSRALASLNLFRRTNDEKYKMLPAFVLNYWEVDEYLLRILILDSNVPYRTISQETLIKSIIERYELLKRTKKYRSESNIAEILADEFMMSKSSIYNYLCFRKLREEIMTLLLEKRISLQSARYLSRVNHNVQLMILENFGVEKINEIHRIKILTSKDNVKLPYLQKLVNVVNDLVPRKTEVSVTVDSRMLNKYLELVGEFKKYAITNYEDVFKTKNCNSYCKVALNSEHMRFYLEKDIVSQELLDLVNAKNSEELRKCEK